MSTVKHALWLGLLLLVGCSSPRQNVVPVYYDLTPAQVVRYNPSVLGAESEYIDAQLAH